jgi:D-serine deaminase-like pyridoxal phosphate-dependent protein
MIKSDLCTPAVLVDVEKLKKNIRDIQEDCTQHKKNLIPMTKTHKSSFIARLQLDADASGLLVGTIREAEQFAALNPLSITFAYPFIGEKNLQRMLAVGKRIPIMVSIDALETAKRYDEFCRKNDTQWEYLLIVDVGLHRFGIDPNLAGDVVQAIASSCFHLTFAGLSSHPGNVYRSANASEAITCGAEETFLLRQAKDAVTAAGYVCNIIASGSTPTLSSEIHSDIISTIRPGNYVFYDTIQTLYGADQGRCALTVLASVIGKRSDRKWIIDAGSKCLGLDKGAHGNSAINGYGTVIGRPGLIITSLSEEIGILESQQPMALQIGDRIEIIPNHSCSTANMSSHVILCIQNDIVGYYEVDAREGTYIPHIYDVTDWTDR